MAFTQPTSAPHCFIILAIIAFFIPGESYSFSSPDKSFQRTSHQLSRHIRYAYTIENRSPNVARDVHFWTYAPVKVTPTQICTKISSSNHYELITDEYQNQILHYVFDFIPPYGSKRITVDVDLVFSKTPNQSSPDNLEEYLLPERFIECDNREIRTLAQQLHKNHLMGTVESIFHWIVENMSSPGYLHNERGALYALQNQKGDCTEYMYLFVALCRAEGIPARCLGGYICSQNSILKSNQYHNWAEFYFQGSWRIADPHKNTFLENHSDYVAFHVMKSSPANPISGFSRFHVRGKGLHVWMD